MFSKEVKGLYTLAVIVSLAFIAPLYALVGTLDLLLILVVFYSPLILWIFKKKLPKKMIKYLIKERKSVVSLIKSAVLIMAVAIAVLFAGAYSIDWIVWKYGVGALLVLAFIGIVVWNSWEEK
ncbi:hypothetical protein LCGC14_1825170 [marine sediment metagenome]|uniref:Uncharacterized protein n=1 Tax=marine sediment metagenome TaxID=412755 RepID=A0A0F9IXE3_9ZZZZ